MSLLAALMPAFGRRPLRPPPKPFGPLAGGGPPARLRRAGGGGTRGAPPTGGDAKGFALRKDKSKSLILAPNER